MARAPDSILKDDIPIDNLRWALPWRYFFAEEAGVLQKPMTLGHSHASMAATLAYWVLRGVPAVGVAVDTAKAVAKARGRLPPF